ncbi:MAG: polysaccharide pyruvyl transferase family protein [Rikenellaceae bacterium]
MRIGVITLPLHTNYGGILQAYALQRVLRELGHDVSLVERPRRKRRLHPIRAIWTLPQRIFRRYFLGDRESILLLERRIEGEYSVVSQHTQLFVERYISRLSCSNYSDIDSQLLDAIVVGSDQVWRAEYFGSIGDAYLQFARGWSIKRIAYAASFGDDEWRYSASATRLCRELASMFDWVSVRERSAQELLSVHLGVESSCVLDPTMLLQREDYEELVHRANEPQSGGDLLTYMLDDSPERESIIGSIATSRSLTPFSTKGSNSFCVGLEERVQPPIERWIRGFMDAEFVATDSFHATLFAILFNKPFVTYCNSDRGATRFHTLLESFELESQLITSPCEVDIERCYSIDWARVNERLDELRSSSLEWLSNALK